MSESPAPEKSPAPPARPARLPLWSRILIVLAVLAMGAGLALPLVLPEPAPVEGVPTGVVAGFAGDGAAAPAPAEPPGLSAWSPAVFRLGFSFFVGFAMAYALRAFLRLAIVAIGFFFIAMFGLQYSGLIEVKWALVQERYDALSGQIEQQARSFWSYAVAYLPSAAAASAGALAGFWRKRPV